MKGRKKKIYLKEKGLVPFNQNYLLQTVSRTVEEINETSKDFLAIKKSGPILLIKGVGRFCACGCNRQIPDGKWVKSISIRGKPYMRYVKTRSDQIYATSKCGSHMRDKERPNHLSKESIQCLLKLSIKYDTSEYRELILYPGGEQKFLIKITPEHNQLWETLNAISKYRHIPKKDMQELIA